MHRAKLAPDKEGGANIGRIWVCPDCRTENLPIDTLLLKMHPLRCSDPMCGTRNPTGHVWSMVTAVLNGVKLDMHIHNQGPFGTCSAHAFVAGLDFAKRIGGAIHGLVLTHPLDVKDLLQKFNVVYNDPLGAEKVTVLTHYRIPCLFSIVHMQGIQYLMPPCQNPLIPASTPQVLKIKSAFEVSTADSDYIVHLLAAGIPLVTAAPLGRCFRYVSSGQIYDAPPVVCSHAILLIGFGVANWPGDDGGNPALAGWPEDKSGNKLPRVFFRARNSWGDKEHANYALAGKGADFDIWADQVYERAYGFHLQDAP